MTNSSISAEIQHLRMKSLQRVLESILLMIAALFITALLPSLLLRYVYTSSQLLEQPRALEAIPVIAFIIAVGYFLYVLVTNVTRERRIAQLEKEMLSMGDVTNSDVTAAELAELEVMVEEALQESETPKAARPARKTTKPKARRARK